MHVRKDASGRLSVSPHKILVISGARTFAQVNVRESYEAGEAYDPLNVIAYYPDLKLAGRLYDIRDLLIEYDFTSVPVGKKFTMTEEANSLLLANDQDTGQNMRIINDAYAGGSINIVDTDVDIKLYENIFDPLLDADNEVIEILFPSPQVTYVDSLTRQKEAMMSLSSDREKIEYVIEYKEGRAHHIVVPLQKFISDVYYTIEILINPDYRYRPDAFSPAEIEAALDDMLANPDFPLTMAGNGNFVGDRKKLLAIDDALKYSNQLDTVFSSALYDPSNAYDFTSQEDVEALLSDIRMLVEAGILENHDFKLTAVMPLIY